MKVLKIRVLLILLGAILIILSNNIFDIFYTGVRSEVFEITKTISIMFIGIVIVLVGILFPFSDKPKNKDIR
ncbi:hypothetical protein [Clostridium sp.]|uniref:hypothetical protein n=1 Tax=Clostridium sp. TaxID=1506 RepID=UPI0026DD8577|nr:hypothetical protein [Clostridium sp.]MDO5040088.1 hypothetical protein [Clostridium sp.]